MSTPNPVVSEAVAKLNEQRTEQVVNEAVRLASCIRSEQDKIDAANKRIVELRVEADKLAKDVITETSVLGSPLPDNANKATLAKIIELANKNRQYGIEQAGTRLTTAIQSEKDLIVALEKRIAELRAAILKLEVPTITTEQIVGS